VGHRSERRTFEKIQKQQSWRTGLLFTLLTSVYFTASLIFYVVIKFILLIWVFLGSGTGHGIVKFREIGFVFLFSLLAALFHWILARSGMRERMLLILGARELDKEDEYHKRFRKVVDELSLAAGLDRVDCVVIPTVAMNAFTLDDNKKRPVLGITEGLLSRLSRNELQAVCAHELAHVLNRDCSLTTMACGMCGAISAMLDANRGEDIKGREVMTPLFPLVAVLYLMALLLNTAISRRREFAADALAIKLTRNPLALADALKRIGRATRSAAPEGLSPLFIIGSDSEEGEGFLANLFYTHPPLKRRIAAILEVAGMLPVRAEMEAGRNPSSEKGEHKEAERFHVFDRRDGTWTRSLSPAEIGALGWAGPETWLVPEGGGKAVPLAGSKVAAEILTNAVGHSTRGACPKCGTGLVAEAYEGTRIDRCPSCGGCLVQEDRVRRIMFRKDAVMGPEVVKAAGRFKKQVPLRPKRSKRADALELGLPKPLCPRCHREMYTAPYSYQYFVEVDRCMTCGLIWFDRQELEILQALVEGGDRI